MEKKSKMRMVCGNDLTVADMLCSAGYLPPRNERDLERFERLYYCRSFELETYSIDADAIFDKVMLNTTIKNNSNNKQLLQIGNSQLKAANSIEGKE